MFPRWPQELRSISNNSYDFYGWRTKLASELATLCLYLPRIQFVLLCRNGERKTRNSRTFASLLEAGLQSRRCCQKNMRSGRRKSGEYAHGAKMVSAKPVRSAKEALRDRQPFEKSSLNNQKTDLRVRNPEVSKHRAHAPSSLQSRPCAIGLPPIPVDGSFPAWKAVRERRAS